MSASHLKLPDCITLISRLLTVRVKALLKLQARWSQAAVALFGSQATA
jgi:hypothetical protein